MIQSVARAARILEVLVDRAPQATLGEIAKDSGLPPPTTHRVLQTLVGLGYAVSLENGQYKPGPKILVLAGRLLTSMDYSVHVRPALLRLQEHTPETIHFGVLSGDEAQYVDKLEARRPYRLASVVGMALQLHCTAIGKAILAYLPAERAARLITPDKLVQRTAKTITSVDVLTRELTRIREQGFCIDDEEDREGVRCVGAPVFDHQRQVFGAVSVSGPTFQFSAQDALALAPHVMDAARDTSLSMGAPPESLPTVLRSGLSTVSP